MYEKIILLAIGFLGLGVSAQAQQAVSAAIINRFQELYETAEDIEWEENDNETYVAYFVLRDNYAQATFSKDAEWLSTSTFLSEEDLPSALVKGVAKATADEFSYAEIEKIETPANVQFKVELETDEEIIELLLDKDGKILKKKIQKFD